MVFPVVMYGCESWTVKKAEHRRIDAFELGCWRRLLRVPWTARRSNQSILKEISPGISLEGTMLNLKLHFGLKLKLWPPYAKSWLIGKDCDAGRDWGQEEKGTTEGDKAGWHHRLNGHEFLWTPGVGDGQGDLVCCDSWSRKESDTTEQLNWTELMLDSFWIGNSNRCSNINNLIVTNLNHLQLRGIKYFSFICYHYFQFPHSVFQEIFKHKTSSQRQTRWQMSWWTWSKSLHGYIRNTPSDTKVHAEHQLRVDRRTWPLEKNI